MIKTKDLIRQTFNRLTVVSRASDSKSGNVRWDCVCTCGKSVAGVQVGNLKSGQVKSCGCLKLEVLAVIKKTHGLRSSPEYSTWSKMLQRCHNQNNPKYVIYGARGIQVCDRWRTSFDNFYTDMGPKPSPKHSIDRVDNNGNYSPENCKWATKTEQANNTRSNIVITYEGLTKTLGEWCRDLNANYHRVYGRLRRGVKFEVAIEDRSTVNLKLSALVDVDKTLHLSDMRP